MRPIYYQAKLTVTVRIRLLHNYCSHS